MQSIGANQVNFVTRASAVHRIPYLPYLVGMIDASVTLSYLLNLSPTLWHVMTLALKIGIFVVFIRNTKVVPNAVYYFLGSIFILCAVSVFMTKSLSDYAAPIGFMAHIFLDAVLVRNEVRRYCASLSIFITVTAAFHIALCLAHVLPDAWGRYYYFGNSDPNLGGEINAIGAFSAALSLRRNHAILSVVVLLLSSSLMQSRAAMITIFLILVLLLIFNRFQKLSMSRLIALANAIMIGVTILIAFGGLSILTNPVVDALQLNSQDRGISSGFSGRADLWALSWLMFLDSPLVGHGFGFFSAIDFIGSHNLLLQSLAQFGLLGLIPISIIIFQMWNFARNSLFNLGLILAISVLLFFNDRFINLNPYPFALYVILLLWRKPAQSPNALPT